MLKNMNKRKKLNEITKFIFHNEKKSIPINIGIHPKEQQKAEKNKKEDVIHDHDKDNEYLERKTTVTNIENNNINNQNIIPNMNYPKELITGKVFEDVRKEIQDILLNEKETIPFQNLFKFSYCSELFGEDKNSIDFIDIHNNSDLNNNIDNSNSPNNSDIDLEMNNQKITSSLRKINIQTSNNKAIVYDKLSTFYKVKKIKDQENKYIDSHKVQNPLLINYKENDYNINNISNYQNINKFKNDHDYYIKNTSKKNEDINNMNFNWKHIDDFNYNTKVFNNNTNKIVNASDNNFYNISKNNSFNEEEFYNNKYFNN